MIIDSNIVFGIISIVASLIIAAVGYGVMKQKVESMKEIQCKYEYDHNRQHEKEDEQTREAIKELTTFKENTGRVIERLTTLIEQVFNRLESIEDKLDKAIEGGK